MNLIEWPDQWQPTGQTKQGRDTHIEEHGVSGKVTIMNTSLHIKEEALTP